MSDSSSVESAAASSLTPGYRAKTFGVTEFTILSVHCADKMVATSSW